MGSGVALFSFYNYKSDVTHGVLNFIPALPIFTLHFCSLLALHSSSPCAPIATLPYSQVLLSRKNLLQFSISSSLTAPSLCWAPTQKQPHTITFARRIQLVSLQYHPTCVRSISIPTTNHYTEPIRPNSRRCIGFTRTHAQAPYAPSKWGK